MVQSRLSNNGVSSATGKIGKFEFEGDQIWQQPCHLLFLMTKFVFLTLNFETVLSWFRTSVHWAVLHNNVRALEILLQHGCNPYPPKPRVNVAKRTSGAIEFPSEMCERLYGHSKSGETIQSLLKRYQYTKSTE